MMKLVKYSLLLLKDVSCIKSKLLNILDGNQNITSCNTCSACEKSQVVEVKQVSKEMKIVENWVTFTTNLVGKDSTCLLCKSLLGNGNSCFSNKCSEIKELFSNNKCWYCLSTSHQAGEIRNVFKDGSRTTAQILLLKNCCHLVNDRDYCFLCFRTKEECQGHAWDVFNIFK